MIVAGNSPQTETTPEFGLPSMRKTFMAGQQMEIGPIIKIAAGRAPHRRKRLSNAIRCRKIKNVMT